MKEALKATSVLPNPTSPQINLSCGFSESKSAMTSLMTLSWSGVSVNLKVLQNFSYSLVSRDTFCEASKFLLASASKISDAISKAFNFDFCDFSLHFFLLKESKGISFTPIYGVIWDIEFTGT